MLNPELGAGPLTYRYWSGLYRSPRLVPPTEEQAGDPSIDVYPGIRETIGTGLNQWTGGNPTLLDVTLRGPTRVTR